MEPFITVIMAGGSGTRFWPLSQKSFPKQYLKLLGDKSLIQETVSRISSLTTTKDIYICSGKSQVALLKEQLPEIRGLILEPVARNTAPCLMLTVATLLRKGYPLSTPMIVLPADHHVGNVPAFLKNVEKAVSFAAKSSAIVTLGVVPTSPHTGYGYIEAAEAAEDGVFKVRRFVEKPSLEKAETFLREKTFFWNCGIFAWRLDTICQAFEEFMEKEWKEVQSFASEDQLGPIFEKLKSQPIDTAILEKAKNVFVVPANSMQWSDIGSWNALLELKLQKPNGNAVLSGNVREIETHRCLVNVPKDKTVALVGVEDLIIVEKDGVLLIAHRTKDQLVRQIADDSKDAKR